MLNGEFYREVVEILANIVPAIHIYMGGVGVQQFFILVFLFFAIQFHRNILQQLRQGVEEVSSALPLLYAIYAVLMLITVS